ncbi:uncharacterized protein B0P05DRAFT_585438 [Gilbertella persicaria]|uniref:uncharacterized protein n=1 Tax=Gilbertella persicaria TaxID=101096 RepID=UPI002220FAEC|nr:uncharacterized protein B0P05DRAFT_585438 [Gilbertella persicaria]KAI8085932.1 hypothetical protein B0P05DRAFT_585438 [Gilbertella persicaria]
MSFQRPQTLFKHNLLSFTKRFNSHKPNNGPKIPKPPRYSPQNQQILNDYMIPGPALKFFKTKRTKREPKQKIWQATRHDIEHIYTTPARSINYNEFDSAPTVIQERLAERIQRAITTMYSTEVLPSKWITLSHVSIRAVKVSRNLRKCRVLYEPLSTKKSERGHIHRALQDYTPLLNSMIRSHAHIRHPLSIKFVPDTQAKELEDIFERLLL